MCVRAHVCDVQILVCGVFISVVCSIYSMWCVLCFVCSVHTCGGVWCVNIMDIICGMWYVWHVVFVVCVLVVGVNNWCPWW